MCCMATAKAKKEFLAELGKRRTFTAWKVLCSSGRVPNGSPVFLYRPGINVDPQAPKGRYNKRRPRGLHVCKKAAFCLYPQKWERQVCVICHRDDIIAVGGDQIVVRKLTIRKADWKAAGLETPQRRTEPSTGTKREAE